MTNSKVMTYQGYKNRDTWLINLWLNNDANLYGAFKDALKLSQPIPELKRIVREARTLGIIKDKFYIRAVDWKTIVNQNRDLINS